MKNNLKPTLCWSCKRAVKNKCCWAEHFKPVKGWLAVPTTLGTGRKYDKITESFRVVKCPEFIRG